MFTGIIEEVGIVKSVKRKSGGLIIEINAPKSTDELNIGDSVAINGVCQTVISKMKGSFFVEAVEETLKKTTFKTLKNSTRVNIELPLRLNERMGGHIVLGHVDATGRIEKIQKNKNSWIFSLSYPKIFSKYIIPEGSIAIDGVSLTIASSDKNEIIISIIPHTMKNTIFSDYKLGSSVNLEFDVIGKYIEKLTSTEQKSKATQSWATENKLRNLGF